MKLKTKIPVKAHFRSKKSEEQKKAEEIAKLPPEARPSGRKPHAAGGPDSRWVPDQRVVERVEHLAGLGLNQEQICHVIGISVDTFTRRIKEGHTELADAVKRGRSKGTAIVANAFFEKAKEGSFAHAAMYMNNVAGWSNFKEQRELSGKDGGPIQVSLNKLQNAF